MEWRRNHTQRRTAWSYYSHIMSWSSKKSSAVGKVVGSTVVGARWMNEKRRECITRNPNSHWVTSGVINWNRDFIDFSNCGMSEVGNLRSNVRKIQVSLQRFGRKCSCDNRVSFGVGCVVQTIGGIASPLSTTSNWARTAKYELRFEWYLIPMLITISSCFQEIWHIVD